MKIIYHANIGILLATFLMFADAFTTMPDPVEDYSKYTVSGQIEYTGRYCGGAPPPQRLLENIRKKKPRAGFKLYIRAGNMNDSRAPIIDSTMTDEHGRFIFHLPPGDYVLLSSYHKNREIFTTWRNDDYIRISDRNCLEKWWRDGLAKFSVRNQPVDDIYLHFQKQCFLPLGVPCLVYKGPFPP